MDRAYLLDRINTPEYHGMTIDELMVEWGIETEDKPLLLEILTGLVRDGLLFLSKKRRYISMREKGYLIGTLSTHERGFAFFREQGTKEEYFIPNKSLGDAQNRDTVLLRPLKGKAPVGNRKEGVVEKVLKRGTHTFVGKIGKTKGTWVVQPIDDKVFGGFFYEGFGVAQGDLVLCKILEYPNGRQFGKAIGVSPAGVLKDSDIAILEIMARYGIPEEFPKSVLEAAKQVPTEVLEDEARGRKDLRDLLMVTIDGEDARDFDDAVSVERIEDGYRLGVHIADVSHYVPEGSIIDKEAFERATSVYFPDRVLPMLPLELSNNICSLNQGVNRMAMTAMMDIDSKGKVLRYELYPSLIQVHRRMTYTNVAKILRRLEEPEHMAELTEYVELFPWFDEMSVLANILTNRRMERGAVFFDFPELKIRVDQIGKPVELTKRIRNQAETIIEEFMLLANETVAEHLYWLEAPCVYRVHEEPPKEGVLNFNTAAAPYGFRLIPDGEGSVHPKQYQELVQKLEGHPMKEMLSSLMLRSMSHARYDTKAIGHFGLSCIYYCHFTSPIRRYPDLEVHRILKRYFRTGLPESKEKAEINHQAYRVATQSSEREILAESAERDVDKIKSVEYMSAFVGEVFQGRISGMIGSGIFVQLENLTEGFLPFHILNGYYTFHEKELVARDGSGKVAYRMGDSIRVRLVKAEILTGHLDFDLEVSDTHDQNR